MKKIIQEIIIALMICRSLFMGFINTDLRAKKQGEIFCDPTDLIKRNGQK